MREAISTDTSSRRLHVVIRATIFLQDKGEASVYKFIIPTTVPGTGSDTWETHKAAFREELESALVSVLPSLVLEIEDKFVHAWDKKEGYPVKITLG